MGCDGVRGRPASAHIARSLIGRPQPTAHSARSPPPHKKVEGVCPLGWVYRTQRWARGRGGSAPFVSGSPVYQVRCGGDGGGGGGGGGGRAGQPRVPGVLRRWHPVTVTVTLRGRRARGEAAAGERGAVGRGASGGTISKSTMAPAGTASGMWPGTLRPAVSRVR
jgi:hypothetical protein